MDPLTHTLAGANLGATRLGLKTRFAAAALVIGANLPDVDAILYFGDSDLAQGFRRGWTHGILALCLWPFLLTGLLLAIDRLRPNPEKPVNVRWLLILSAIAIWSHPTLDWLNTYGMRWLMPFDGTWFYGDSVYIMDPWLWLVLGCGWLIGQRPTAITLGGWLLFTGAIVWIVRGRSPEYLPVVALVAAVLLATLLFRPVKANAQKFATAALVLATLYIGSRLVTHEMTERTVAQRLAPVERLMAGPHPINPLQWNLIVQKDGLYHLGRFHWYGQQLQIDEPWMPAAKPSPEFTEACLHPAIDGWATWLRFPAYTVERQGAQTRVTVYDARRSSGRTVVLPARR